MPQEAIASQHLDPEEFAAALLARSDWSASSCHKLLALAFPKPTSNRRGSVLQNADLVNYFVVGAFGYRGSAGLSQASKRRVTVMQFLNKWLLHRFPGQSWASIAVSHDQMTGLHTDSGNEPNTFNHTVSVGSFAEGHLWLQDEAHGTIPLSHPQTGQTVWGVKVATWDKGFSFCPHVLHGTLPWTGDRWALTAFTPKGLTGLDAASRRQLMHWGFPWSPPADAPGAQALHQSSQGRASLTSGDVAQESRKVFIASPPDAAQEPCTLPPHVPLPDTSTTRIVGAHTGLEDVWLASKESLPQRLAAARPVTWRGSGDLLQLPGISAPQGSWLVIDLWAGFSGLCIALLALGVAFYGIAAEQDGDARACAHHAMPALVHVADVNDVSAEALLPLLHRRKLRGVIVGGGSPCQPNSCLNSTRKGLKDPRGSAPQVLHALVQELESHPEFRSLEIISFLENVASAPKDVIEAYSSWAGCLPIRSDASCCGWTSRNRLYWVRGRTRSIAEASPPAMGICTRLRIRRAAAV